MAAGRCPMRNGAIQIHRGFRRSGCRLFGICVQKLTVSKRRSGTGRAVERSTNLHRPPGTALVEERRSCCTSLGCAPDRNDGPPRRCRNPPPRQCGDRLRQRRSRRLFRRQRLFRQILLFASGTSRRIAGMSFSRTAQPFRRPHELASGGRSRKGPPSPREGRLSQFRGEHGRFAIGHNGSEGTVSFTPRGSAVEPAS